MGFNIAVPGDRVRRRISLYSLSSGVSGCFIPAGRCRDPGNNPFPTDRRPGFNPAPGIISDGPRCIFSTGRIGFNQGRVFRSNAAAFNPASLSRACPGERALGSGWNASDTFTPADAAAAHLAAVPGYPGFRIPDAAGIHPGTDRSSPVAGKRAFYRSGFRPFQSLCGNPGFGRIPVYRRTDVRLYPGKGDLIDIAYLIVV